MGDVIEPRSANVEAAFALSPRQRSWGALAKASTLRPCPSPSTSKSGSRSTNYGITCTPYACASRDCDVMLTCTATVTSHHRSSTATRRQTYICQRPRSSFPTHPSLPSPSPNASPLYIPTFLSRCHYSRTSSTSGWSGFAPARGKSGVIHFLHIPLVVFLVPRSSSLLFHLANSVVAPA